MFTQEDLAHAENLVRAIKKGEFKLEGLEVLALSDAMRWLSRLTKVISLNLQDQQKPAIETSNPSPVITPAPQAVVKRQRKVKE